MQNVRPKVPTIIPMEVTDVVGNYYILQTPDRTKEYKMQVGLLDTMENGLLVAVGDNTYIQLIINDEEDVTNVTERDDNSHRDDNIDDVEAPLGEENTLLSNTSSDLDSTAFSNLENSTSTEDRHNWTYDQTMCLIDSMASHIDELNHPKKRRFIFNNIANDLLSSGFSISSSTCQNKWKNLLRSYKVAKDNKNKTGRGPSRFHFFDKMDDLLGEKPSNKCSHSLESSTLTNVEDGFTPGLEEPSTSINIEEPQLKPPKKRARCSNSTNQDFITLKKEEYKKKTD